MMRDKIYLVEKCWLDKKKLEKEEKSVLRFLKNIQSLVLFCFVSVKNKRKIRKHHFFLNKYIANEKGNDLFI